MRLVGAAGSFVVSPGCWTERNSVDWSGENHGPAARTTGPLCELERPCLKRRPAVGTTHKAVVGELGVAPFCFAMSLLDTSLHTQRLQSRSNAMLSGYAIPHCGPPARKIFELNPSPSGSLSRSSTNRTS